MAERKCKTLTGNRSSPSRGGARKGAGRKPTGRNITKAMTLSETVVSQLKLTGNASETTDLALRAWFKSNNFDEAVRRQKVPRNGLAAVNPNLRPIRAYQICAMLTFIQESLITDLKSGDLDYAVGHSIYLLGVLQERIKPLVEEEHSQDSC